MNKIMLRLGIFFVGIPVIAGVILFLPYYNYLATALLVLGASIIGAFEMGRIAKLDNYHPSARFMIFSGLLFPVISWLVISGYLPEESVTITLVILLMFTLGKAGVIMKPDNLTGSLRRTGYRILLVLYPGFFLSYVIRITSLNESNFALLAFLLLVFSNDSAAYAVGSLLGGKSRKIFPASPNKSIAGFLGGFAGSIIMAALIMIIRPRIFYNSWILAGIAAVSVAALAVIGDLVESAFKRSVNLKDSGSVVPGRGGILDSVDSILYAAPFFFFLMKWAPLAL